jgi:hypothetical protein
MRRLGGAAVEPVRSPGWIVGASREVALSEEDSADYGFQSKSSYAGMILEGKHNGGEWQHLCERTDFERTEALVPQGVPKGLPTRYPVPRQISWSHLEAVLIAEPLATW